MQNSPSSPAEAHAARHPMSSPDVLLSSTAQPDRKSGAPAYQYRQRDRGSQLATVLGWFSIGLGVAELLAPRRMSDAAGVRGNAAAVRACGMREIASGAGILSGHRTSNWLWSRVAGDLLDLALLGAGARGSGVRGNRVALTAAMLAGITAVDVMSSMRQRRHERNNGIEGAVGDIFVEKSMTVNRSPDECYRFWRNFENFPRFMQHLESVEEISDTRSHWVAVGPAGTRVEWDADLVADEPGALLAWRSLDNADVENAGIVRFETATGGRGTVVRVEMQYSPPGGMAGALFAKLFREEPSQQIDEDLRHFKQLMETGEISTTVGQASGQRSVIGRLLRKGAPG
jgi:uncharacterized membrane protein